MEFAQKEQLVAEVGERLASSQAAYLVHYQGCTCEELTGVRGKLRETGAHFQVVKNTLLKRAVEGTGAADLSKLLEGPTAVIWANDAIVEPAKILSDFAQDRETFAIRGGFVDGAVVDENGVKALAKMPSKQELQAKLLALINAPAVQLLRMVNAPASSLVRLLAAWRDELEKRENA